MFPFWIVCQRGAAIPVLVAAKCEPHYVAAFTTAQKGTAYMVRLGATAWEFKLVSRGPFLAMLPDLRAMGLKGVCFDPDEDTCARKMRFEEIERETGSSAELPAYRPGSR